MGGHNHPSQFGYFGYTFQCSVYADQRIAQQLLSSSLFHVARNLTPGHKVGSVLHTTICSGRPTVFVAFLIRHHWVSSPTIARCVDPSTCQSSSRFQRIRVNHRRYNGSLTGVNLREQTQMNDEAFSVEEIANGIWTQNYCTAATERVRPQEK